MKKRFVLTTILVLGVLFLLTTVVSADREDSTSQGILFAGSLGGDISAVAIDGSLAYFGEGSNLVVMDVSDPLAPTSIARLTLPGVVYDLVISAGVAYIADGAGGLQVVDIHNPSHVNILRNLATDCPATSLFVDGSSLYLGEGTCGLQIVDVSDPGNPLLRGSYPGLVNDTWVDGGRAYLVGAYLSILNVSNPDAPELLGKYADGIYLSSVLVNGDFAYVDNRVYDVSNPVSPTLLTGLQLSYSIRDMVFSGSTAYVLSIYSEILPRIDYCQVNVLDLSDPLAPVEIGEYSRLAIGIQDCHGHLVSNSGSVYVANGNFEIVDVSDPQNPALLGGYVPRLRPTDVQTKGRLAYLVDEQKGLQIMDADDVDNPVLVGSYPYDLPESANRLLVSGKRAYVSVHIPTDPRALAGKLDILDISNPVSPTLMGSFGVSDIQDMYMDGGRAYLIDSRYAFPPQLEIVDISTPSNSKLLSVYGSTIDHLKSVYAKGDYVYVFNYDRLQVLDVSNPVSPTLSGRLDCKFLTDIQGTGNLIYGLAYTSLYFIDITNPVSPTIINQYDYVGDGNQLQVTNGLASIALQDRGVEIVDVHDPLTPVKLAS